MAKHKWVSLGFFHPTYRGPIHPFNWPIMIFTNLELLLLRDSSLTGETFRIWKENGDLFFVFHLPEKLNKQPHHYKMGPY